MYGIGENVVRKPHLRSLRLSLREAADSSSAIGHTLKSGKTEDGQTDAYER